MWSWTLAFAREAKGGKRETKGGKREEKEGARKASRRSPSKIRTNPQSLVSYHNSIAFFAFFFLLHGKEVLLGAALKL